MGRAGGVEGVAGQNMLPPIHPSNPSIHPINGGVIGLLPPPLRACSQRSQRATSQATHTASHFPRPFQAEGERERMALSESGRQRHGLPGPRHHRAAWLPAGPGRRHPVHEMSFRWSDGQIYCSG